MKLDPQTGHPLFVELTLVSSISGGETGKIKINPMLVSSLQEEYPNITSLGCTGDFYSVKGSVAEVEAKLCGVLPESNETSDLSGER